MTHFPDIGQQIIQLQHADELLRNKLIAEGKLHQGYNIEMEKLHIYNAERLQEIIEKIGYPTREKVDSKASAAAWLIIQHAISLPMFMKQCFTSLKEAVDQGKADPIHLAYLEDRIAFFEGKAQLYGTQFDWDCEGQLSPHLYDSIENVNARRKKLGLITLEEQTIQMRRQAKQDNESAPENYQERFDEMMSWKKKVGWI